MATNKDSNKQTPSAVKPTADKTFTSAKDSNIKERARAICCKLLLVLKKILGIDKGSNKQVPTVVPSTTDSSIISTIVTDKDLDQAVLDEYGYGALYSKDGKRLLKGPKGFSHYDIKEGTEIICNSAFCQCYNLTSISIPTSVTTIGSAAFRYCDKLSSITIPPSVHTMKGNPFLEWRGKIEIKSPYFKYKNGVLFDVKKGILVAFLSYGRHYIIPQGITTIGPMAFCGSQLDSLTIPPSVTTIGYEAFSYCYGLTSIAIPSSVTTIGSAAFRGCKSLTSIIIPLGVTTIDDSAFSGCSRLTSIAIPSSVTTIGSAAFRGCKSLTSIIIPLGVTTIGDSAFSDCSSLTSITIPSSVTTIGSAAFSGCI